jgi:hypothetical protein
VETVLDDRAVGSCFELPLLVDTEIRAVGVLAVDVERGVPRNGAVGVLVEISPVGEVTRRRLSGSDGVATKSPFAVNVALPLLSWETELNVIVML